MSCRARLRGDVTVSKLIVSLQDGQRAVNGRLLRTHSPRRPRPHGPRVPKPPTERPLYGALLPAAKKGAAGEKDSDLSSLAVHFPPADLVGTRLEGL